MISKNQLLMELPVFENSKMLISKKQAIHDIIKEVIEAHKVFSCDYDLIYQYFDKGTIPDICRRLFDFCKKNIIYEIETEDYQTTKSPGAILSTNSGDCKHYAGFIAGVLSAISRNEKKINWCYRFANYSFFSNEMQHVFVIVFYNNQEIWIDPVLGYFNSRSAIPVNFIDKKINDMALNRVSGIGLISPTDTISKLINFNSTYLQENAQTQMVNLPVDAIQPDDYYSVTIDATLEDNIKQLLYYGIIDQDLNIHNDVYMQTMEALNEADAAILGQAYGEFLNKVHSEPTAGTVGNIFSSIWGSVKQVSLAIPRGAYLSLVSLNVFNLAGHLNKCIVNTDGSTDQAGIDKLQNVWHKKLAGDTNILLRAIRNGAHKKAILGDVEMNESMGLVAAWAVTASAIIVAMTPIITSILKSKNSFDSMAASQLAMQPISSTGQTYGSSSSNLPILLIAGAGIYLLMTKKKK